MTSLVRSTNPDRVENQRLIELGISGELTTLRDNSLLTKFVMLVTDLLHGGSQS